MVRCLHKPFTMITTMLFIEIHRWTERYTYTHLKDFFKDTYTQTGLFLVYFKQVEWLNVTFYTNVKKNTQQAFT